MRVRVLGCSGAIAKDCRTTSFLIDNDVLIDAGTGLGDLTLQEMAGIEHVLLTHSHLDHIAVLPLMIDSVGGRRRTPLQIHALPGTIAALRAHIFNDVIWPDFSVIPTPEAPFICFHEIATGQTLHIGGKTIEALPAVHTVPAVGYAVTGSTGGTFVFSGDTGGGPAFWQRVNQIDVALLVIETAFSNREKDLARRSLHLSPHVLADELAHIARGKTFPIFITHTKPAETAMIMDEIRQFDQAIAPRDATHNIHWLYAGQEFAL